MHSIDIVFPKLKNSAITNLQNIIATYFLNNLEKCDKIDFA